MNKKYRIALLLSIVLIFFLWVVGIGKEIDFDEAPWWKIVTTRSVESILIGKFTEAALPLGLIFMKMFLYIFGSRIELLRLFPLAFGLASLLIVYHLFSLAGNRYKWIALGLTSLSPALIYYSNLFRTYSIGFFFQMGCLFFLFRSASRLNKKNDLWWSSIFLFIGLFISHSTAYLMIFSVWWWWWNRDRLKLSKKLIAFYVSQVIVFIVWHLFFFMRGGGIQALKNYIGYRDSLYATFLAMINALGDIVVFRWDWGNDGSFLIHDILFGLFSEGLAWLVLIATAFLTVKNLKQQRSARFRHNTLRLMQPDQQLVFFCTLLFGVVFFCSAMSFIFPVDLFAIKFWLVLIPPFFYLFSYYFSNRWGIIVVMLTTLLVMNIRNSTLPRFPIRDVYNFLEEQSEEENTPILILSHELSYDSLSYYESRYRFGTLNHYRLLPVNSNNYYQTDIVVRFLQSCLNKQPSCTDTVYYLHYYDDDQIFRLLRGLIISSGFIREDYVFRSGDNDIIFSLSRYRSQEIN